MRLLRWHSPAGRHEFIPARGLPDQPSCWILRPPARIAPQNRAAGFVSLRRARHVRRRWKRGRDAVGWRCRGRGEALHKGAKDGRLQQNLGPRDTAGRVLGLGLLLGARPAPRSAGGVGWCCGPGVSQASLPPPRPWRGLPGHGLAAAPPAPGAVGGSEPR